MIEEEGRKRLRRTRSIKDRGIKGVLGGVGKGWREDPGEGRRSRCGEEDVGG